jgi:hypothetical protein
MGYTTDFSGSVDIDPPLNEDEISYLKDFSRSRRMNREKGPYFVGGGGLYGQDREEDVLDYNQPPAGQPGLWCQWVPGGAEWAQEDEATTLGWDGGEKFYSATHWMRYLIDHFLKPGAEASKNLTDSIAQDQRFANFQFNHVVNGAISAQGEEPDDRWRLRVEDNEVTEEGETAVYLSDLPKDLREAVTQHLEGRNSGA